MSSPRIAIATCADYADLKVDDELLQQALEERGCEAQAVIWDEEGIDWSGFDLCLVRSTWDYNEKHEPFLTWARQAEAASGLRNPAELIAWNSDKHYLRELGERGVRTVPTVWVGEDSRLGLEQILAGTGWDEAVVKPVVDLGARNLHRVRAGEDSVALELILRNQRAMVQPFLPSLEGQGELSLVYIEGELSHAVRKRPAAGDFRVQSIWGGTVSREEPTGAELELAEEALAQFKQVPLYARVDLVEGPTGEPCLIELELIEPNLFLCEHPPAVEALAGAVLRSLD